MIEGKQEGRRSISILHSIRRRIVVLIALVVIGIVFFLVTTFSARMTKVYKELIFNYMEDVAEARGNEMELMLRTYDTMDASVWERLAGGVNVNGMETSYAYVVDKEGIIRYHPVQGEIGKKANVAVISELAAAMKQGNVSNKLAAVEYEYNGEQKYAAYRVSEAGEYIFVITADEADAMFGVNGTVGYCTKAAVIALIAYIIIGAVFSDTIVRPIQKLTDTITLVANLDFRENEKLAKLVQRKDETGAMAQAINTLRESLSEVISSIKESSNTIQKASDHVDKEVQSITSTIEQVNNAVQEVAYGAGSQADETQKATDNVVLMGDMISESAEEMELLGEQSREMLAASDEAASTLGILEKINQEAKEAIEIIYEQTNTTNEAALKIQKATELITSIAEETNLLSLNAAIEAARAGEQGRGFAVVAGQIQKLAEQSNESAKQIENIIKELISDSQEAVQTMDGVKKVMGEQNENVEKTRERFAEVQDGIGKTMDSINMISEKINQIDRARGNVVDVVSSLTAIAEENAASTQETSASVTEVGGHMNAISEDSRRLKAIADTLEQEMQTFQI